MVPTYVKPTEYMITYLKKKNTSVSQQAQTLYSLSFRNASQKESVKDLKLRA